MRKPLYDVQRPVERAAMVKEYLANHIQQDMEWPILEKGKLLKARFPDEPCHNCYWFWVPMGNCSVCDRLVPQDYEGGREYPSCQELRVGAAEFRRFQEEADCPYFELGEPEYPEGSYHWHRTQAMRAAGMLPGRPEVSVTVLQGPIDWSPWRSFQAECQMRWFIAMSEAMAAWRASHGDEPDPSTQEGLDPNRDHGDIDEGEGPSIEQEG